MGDYALKSISPLNGYSRNFKENLLEEVVGMVVISIATSVDNKDFLNRVCIGSFSQKRINFIRSSLGKDVKTSMGPMEVILSKFLLQGLWEETMT